ncbi:MAG: hypothetical protein EXR10_02875 [Alphaproteobacteria bacterium]|nr:hypothetical protein [Alphaproteobacteria bacterium]PHY01087.1 MAG: hypothetical protein CK529_03535 [Rhodospirillaceae bacterium]
MAKPIPPAQKPTPEQPLRSLDDIDVERGVKKVKALRKKFSKAIDDPDMREAMARYIQDLLRDDGRP